MIKTGEFNTLIVRRKTAHGYFLNDQADSNLKGILLPFNNIIDDQTLDTDDEINVFVYRDTQDRLVATQKEPLVTVNNLACLKVVSNTKIGSFVDFGLDRDVLVPLKEQQFYLEEGQKYLFFVYLDKTDRITATSNVDRYLEVSEDYKVGDIVTGVVYGFQTNNSAMIAVDNLYRGVILAQEYFKELHHGDVLELSVSKIYEDGKLGLSPRKKPQIERNELQETLLKYLKAHNGFMPFNDKSSPDEISKEFNTSKNYFKNALGGLMKRGLIVQDASGTKLKQQ